MAMVAAGQFFQSEVNKSQMLGSSGAAGGDVMGVPVGPAPIIMVGNDYSTVKTHDKPHKFEHSHLSKWTCTFTYCVEYDLIK